MSGWIKFEKNIRDDPRFLRMVDQLIANEEEEHRSVTQVRFMERKTVTLLVGSLAQLWMYADSHIREDDTLDLGADEVDQLVGIVGFAKLMPDDWLEVIEEHRVKLPRFQDHNGTEAKKQALTAKRVARHRIKTVTQGSNSSTASSNASALPDQTRPDQTRPDKNPSAAAPPAGKSLAKVARGTEAQDPAWLLDFKLAYPDRAGDQGWRKAVRAAHARFAEGHTPLEFVNGARRYAVFCEATKKTGTEYVKQAASFLGPDKPFLLPWTPPPEPETAFDEMLRLNGLNGATHARTFEPTDEPVRAALGASVRLVRN